MQAHSMTKLSQPPVLILIGVQGGGKTSDAKLLANRMGGRDRDGDEWINPKSWMKWQADKGWPILPFQVHGFVKNDFIPRLKREIQEATAENKILIVSQALFFSSDRSKIVEECGDNIYFLEIETPAELQEAQIRSRCEAQGKADKADREVKSAFTSNPFFQSLEPTANSGKIRHLGKGHDDKFFENFKQLSFYKVFTPCISVAISPTATEESKLTASVSQASMSTSAVISGLDLPVQSPVPAKNSAEYASSPSSTPSSSLDSPTKTASVSDSLEESVLTKPFSTSEHDESDFHLQLTI